MRYFDFLSVISHYSEIASLRKGSIIIVIRQWGEQQGPDTVCRKSEPKLFFVNRHEFFPDRIRIHYVEPDRSEATCLYPKTDFEKQKFRFIISERTGTANVIEPDDTRFD